MYLPDLETAWSENADYIALTFTLRQVVKWYDGRRFTAKDVLCIQGLLMEMSQDKLRIHPRKSAQHPSAMMER